MIPLHFTATRVEERQKIAFNSSGDTKTTDTYVKEIFKLRTHLNFHFFFELLS